MKTVTIREIKNNGSKAIPTDEVSYLVVNSELKSALVPMEQYEIYLEALEELEDIKSTIARIQEEDLPAEDVFAKLLDS